MKQFLFAVRGLGLALCLSLSVAGCYPEGAGLVSSRAAGGSTAGGDSVAEGGAPDSDAGGSPGTVAMCVPRAAEDGAGCHPAQTAEPLLARAVSGAPKARTLFRSDLFNTMD